MLQFFKRKYLRSKKDPKAEETTKGNAGEMPSVGLSKRIFVWGLLQGILPANAAYKKICVCVDALPFSGWRSDCKSGGTPPQYTGDLYCTWVSFLQRCAVKKLAFILAGGKAAVILDGSVDYGQSGRFSVCKEAFESTKDMPHTGNRHKCKAVRRCR